MDLKHERLYWIGVLCICFAIILSLFIGCKKEIPDLKDGQEYLVTVYFKGDDNREFGKIIYCDSIAPDTTQFYSNGRTIGVLSKARPSVRVNIDVVDKIKGETNE